VKIKLKFWDVTWCGLVDVYRRFAGTIASILGDEKSKSNTQFAFSVYSSALRMRTARCYSGTSQTRRRMLPEDSTLQSHLHENPRSAIKVQLSLPLIKQYTMKIYGGSGGKAKESASRPGSCPSGERVPGIH
jgi:hypothetical protein